MAERGTPADGERTPRRHRMGPYDINALIAGGGTEDTVLRLLSVERSWRMLQLRVLLDEVRTRQDAIGPLWPMEQAWSLLARSQRHAPSAVDDLLRHPYLGTWASYTLRRLRGAMPADAPVWLDIGYLYSIAAVAGIRAGLDFAICVPVRDGYVVLPTYGAAKLSSVTERWGLAEVRASGGEAVISGECQTIRIPADPIAGAEGWEALPRVTAEAAGKSIAVNLDFLDPYRYLRTPTAPQPPPVRRVRSWRSLISEAWGLLIEVCPELALPMGKGLSTVAPAAAVEKFRTMSASSGDAFGALIVSEPENAVELAVTLVHEFQHIKLGGLLHLAPLQDNEPPQRMYAPWRDDPRPLGGLLQGVYAFTGVAYFWHALLPTADGVVRLQAEFEFSRWRDQVWLVLESLRGMPELTELGSQLVAGLTATAAKWRDEATPSAARTAAVTALADHRARWRLHHLQPDASTVAQLARAWVDGAGQPVGRPYTASAVVTDSSARLLDTQAVLALWRLTDPVGFRQLQKSAESGGHQRVAGATLADLTLAAGDADRAYELFLTELGSEPAQPGAWAGLGHVAAARGDSAVAALHERPELVRAVHRKVAELTGVSADRLEMARWLSSGR